jgi:hypothetical protein
MYYVNFLVYDQLRLSQLMRDHGFVSWFYKRQEYSQKVYVAHLKGHKNEVTDSVSAYISNMNLVPVYSVWFAFNVVGLLLFCVERTCSCDGNFARKLVLTVWSKDRNYHFFRSLKLLHKMFV